MMMGDREKGEEGAVQQVFPEAPKGSCLLHNAISMYHEQEVESHNYHCVQVGLNRSTAL
jgi:hypothetical protein